jgi:hypothetical protein
VAVTSSLEVGHKLRAVSYWPDDDFGGLLQCEVEDWISMKVSDWLIVFKGRLWLKSHVGHDKELYKDQRDTFQWLKNPEIASLVPTISALPQGCESSSP